MHYAVAAVLSLIVLAAVAGSRPTRITSRLGALESAVADHEKSDRLRTGMDEIDQSAQAIGKCAARWERSRRIPAGNHETSRASFN